MKKKDGKKGGEGEIKQRNERLKEGRKGKKMEEKGR